MARRDERLGRRIRIWSVQSTTTRSSHRRMTVVRPSYDHRMTRGGGQDGALGGEGVAQPRARVVEEPRRDAHLKVPPGPFLCVCVCLCCVCVCVLCVCHTIIT